MKRPYFIKKGDNGQFIIYRRDSVSNNYVMALKYSVEAEEVCNILNKEEIRVQGAFDSYKHEKEQKEEIQRSFWRYRTAIELAYENMIEHYNSDYILNVIEEYRKHGDVNI